MGIIYEGKAYRSLRNLMQSLDRLSEYQMVHKRVSHYKWSLEEALSTPAIRQNKKLEYKGKQYETLKDLVFDLNIKERYDTIQRRITVYKWDVEKAIDTPINNKYNGLSIIYNGEEYKSVRQLYLSLNLNTSKSTFQQKLKEGWSIEDIVSRYGQ